MTNILSLCGYKPKGSSYNPAGSGSNPFCLSVQAEVATCESSMINTWGTNREWLTDQYDQITPLSLIYRSDFKDQSMTFSPYYHHFITHSDTTFMIAIFCGDMI